MDCLAEQEEDADECQAVCTTGNGEVGGQVGATSTLKQKTGRLFLGRKFSYVIQTHLLFTYSAITDTEWILTWIFPVPYLNIIQTSNNTLDSLLNRLKKEKKKKSIFILQRAK